jgi:hypothetical protein
MADEDKDKAPPPPPPAQDDDPPPSGVTFKRTADTSGAGKFRK